MICGISYFITFNNTAIQKIDYKYLFAEEIETDSRILDYRLEFIE